MNRASRWLLLITLFLGGANTAMVRQSNHLIVDQAEYWDAVDWFLAGLALNTGARYEEAGEAFRMSIAIEPKNALSWLNLGTDRALVGDYQEAIRALSESVRLSPRLSLGYANLGEVCFKAGKFKQSIEAFGTLLEFRPNDANARYKRGLAFVSLGETGSALSEYALLRSMDGPLAMRLLDVIHQQEAKQKR